MLTLALETSTSRGGVALFDGNDSVFEHTFTADRSHSSILFTVIEQALAPDRNPDQIVVGLGPGSYAGVRISISAAIGISIASGAKLIGIPSISAMADGEYLAIGDARRETLYFSHVRDGELVIPPTLLASEELQARLANTPLPILSSEALPFPNLRESFPDPARLARLALAGRSIHSRDTLEPLYLRDPHITVPKARP
jgi:tRNA threonylcarbamoyladenosine biosynthesis protein TsaB